MQAGKGPLVVDERSERSESDCKGFVCAILALLRQRCPYVQLVAFSGLVGEEEAQNSKPPPSLQMFGVAELIHCCFWKLAIQGLGAIMKCTCKTLQ